jgi:hypothetical protein
LISSLGVTREAILHAPMTSSTSTSPLDNGGCKHAKPVRRMAAEGFVSPFLVGCNLIAPRAGKQNPDIGSCCSVNGYPRHDCCHAAGGFAHGQGVLVAKMATTSFLVCWLGLCCMRSYPLPRSGRCRTRVKCMISTTIYGSKDEFQFSSTGRFNTIYMLLVPRH